MSDRRNKTDRRNTSDGNDGTILLELVQKYGLGDTVPVAFGPPTYDSGLETLPDTLGVVTAVDTSVSKILLINLTTEIQTINIKDGAGRSYGTDIELKPNEVRTIDYGGAVFASGVKWFAGLGAAVNGQVMGSQDA